MRTHWFTDYTGLKWNPSKHKYNGRFAQEIRAIRDLFKLARVKPGLEAGTDTWLPYDLEGDNYYISISRFEWGKVVVCGGDEYLSPQLRLHVKIADKQKNILFDHDLIVEFMPNYPQSRPRVRTEHPQYAFPDKMGIDDMISHHIYRYGWFCLMHHNDSWNAKGDTVVTILNMSFRLLVWHRKKFGW